MVPCVELAGAERNMFKFETLTYAPIDRALIATSLLGADEMAWIDAYHAEVFKRVSGGLTVAENRWLEAATKPL